MLDDYTKGSQNLVFGSFFVGIVGSLGAFLRWTILILDRITIVAMLDIDSLTTAISMT